MMILIPGARAFVVTACWWRARCKSLRDKSRNWGKISSSFVGT